MDCLCESLCVLTATIEHTIFLYWLIYFYFFSAALKGGSVGLLASVTVMAAFINTGLKKKKKRERPNGTSGTTVSPQMPTCYRLTSNIGLIPKEVARVLEEQKTICQDMA